MLSSYVFIRNKLIILGNAGLYQECINHLEENNRFFARAEFFSTIAECYFHLKDSIMFDSLKLEALFHAEQTFNNAKNESNLVTYLAILKKFDGEVKMIETMDSNKDLLNSNKDWFITPDMYTYMLEVLDKIPTLKIEATSK